MATTTLKQKARGILQILRPELPFAAGVCVILGEIVALGGLPPFREAMLGFVCGFFLSGSAIVLNDYFDLEVDRVNTPERPLPSGLSQALSFFFTKVLISSRCPIKPSASSSSCLRNHPRGLIAPTGNLMSELGSSGARLAG